MRFTRKLIFTLASISILGALLSTAIPVATPAGQCGEIDCATVRQVCRDINAGLYELCVVMGGNASTCAWQEAANNVKCIQDSGCSPQHD